MLASLLGLAVLTGCSTPGSVDAYNDDTRENFLRACKTANDSALSDAEAEELCVCWYEAFEENMSFERFETAEERIREGLDNGTITDAESLRRSNDPALRGYVRVLNEAGCTEAGPLPR